MSAAAGPVRAQLAVLTAALGGGIVLALAGAGYEMITTGNVAQLIADHSGRLGSDLAAGLGTAVICIFVGLAIGHQTVALLSTISAMVLGLLSSVSPANAALRSDGAAIHAAAWSAGAPFLAAASLLAASWLVSVWLAARRSG